MTEATVEQVVRPPETEQAAAAVPEIIGQPCRHYAADLLTWAEHPELEPFMRATYEAHVARSCTRRAFEPSVPDAELTEVARDKYLRHDAARLATRMLSEARNALREATGGGRRGGAGRRLVRHLQRLPLRAAAVPAVAQPVRRLPGRHRPAAGRAAGGAAGLSGRTVAGGLDRDLAGRAGLLQPQRRPGHRPVLPPGQRAGAQRQPRGHPALARHLAAPLADPQRRPLRLPSLREGAVALGAPPGAGHGHADRAGASAAARGSGGRGRRVDDGRQARRPTGSGTCGSGWPETPSSRSSTGRPPSRPSSTPSSRPTTPAISSTCWPGGSTHG